MIDTHTHTFQIEDVRETWPAGILTYEATVRLPSGEGASLKSRASIYHGARYTAELILSPTVSHGTVFGDWKSLATAKAGDAVDFVAEGFGAGHLRRLTD